MSKKSVNFLKVKDYFNRRLWSEKMVLNAVGKWITEEEAEEILGVAESGES